MRSSLILFFLFFFGACSSQPRKLNPEAQSLVVNRTVQSEISDLMSSYESAYFLNSPKVELSFEYKGELIDQVVGALIAHKYGFSHFDVSKNKSQFKLQAKGLFSTADIFNSLIENTPNGLWRSFWIGQLIGGNTANFSSLQKSL